ncbi:MAG: TRAP transporter substrate-binding protein [Clostridiales bacterium]|nr:TRAP transporter substrate-binding protein [Clostridiales bacterium]
MMDCRKQGKYPMVISSRKGRWKIWAALGLAGVVLGCCGCGNSAEESKSLQSDPIGSESELFSEMDYQNADMILSLGCSGVTPTQRGAEELWETSNHTIYINTYGNGKLGGDEDLIRSVQDGTLSLYVGATSGVTAVIPEISLFDIPYQYENLEECNRLLKGELFDWFQQFYQKQGLQLISWGAVSFRELTCNTELKSSGDFLKLKIRTLDNEWHKLYWKSLGAKTLEMNYSDVFYALQQGEINAQENPIGAIIGSNFSSVQKYFVMTNHLPFIYTCVMNKELYDSLTEDQRRYITEYFEGLVQKEIQTDAQVVQMIRERTDMEIITLDADLKQDMKDHNQVVIDTLKEKLGEDIVEEYLTMTASR